MQTATMGIAAPKNQQQTSRQLEAIFRTVDVIKSDLTRCGKCMNGKDPAPFESGVDSFTVRSREQSMQTVKYRYHPNRQVLTRRNGRGKAEVILSGVSDFFAAYFPDSQSVLYRLELNSKEQIRGYIFMNHLQKKEEHNEE